MNTKRYLSDEPGNYFECVPCIGGVLPTTVGRMVPGGYDPNPIPTWWFWGGGGSCCIKIHTNVEAILDFALPSDRLYVCSSQTFIHPQPCVMPVQKQVLKNPKRVIQGFFCPLPADIHTRFFLQKPNTHPTVHQTSGCSLNGY